MYDYRIKCKRVSIMANADGLSCLSVHGATGEGNDLINSLEFFI